MSNYQSYNISAYRKILDRNSKINQKGDLVAFRPEVLYTDSTALTRHIYIISTSFEVLFFLFFLYLSPLYTAPHQ
jgi:hypothetical protein